MRLASCQTPVISALHVGLILLAMMEPLTDCDSTKRLLDVASIERLPPLLSVGATSDKAWNTFRLGLTSSCQLVPNQKLVVSVSAPSSNW